MEDKNKPDRDDEDLQPLDDLFDLEEGDDLLTENVINLDEETVYAPQGMDTIFMGDPTDEEEEGDDEIIDISTLVVEDLEEDSLSEKTGGPDFSEDTIDLPEETMFMGESGEDDGEDDGVVDLSAFSDDEIQIIELEDVAEELDTGLLDLENGEMGDFFGAEEKEASGEDVVDLMVPDEDASMADEEESLAGYPEENLSELTDIVDLSESESESGDALEDAASDVDELTVFRMADTPEEPEPEHIVFDTVPEEEPETDINDADEALIDLAVDELPDIEKPEASHDEDLADEDDDDLLDMAVEGMDFGEDTDKEDDSGEQWAHDDLPGLSDDLTPEADSEGPIYDSSEDNNDDDDTVPLSDEDLMDLAAEAFTDEETPEGGLEEDLPEESGYAGSVSEDVVSEDAVSDDELIDLAALSFPEEGEDREEMMGLETDEAGSDAWGSESGSADEDVLSDEELIGLAAGALDDEDSMDGGLEEELMAGPEDSEDSMDTGPEDLSLDGPDIDSTFLSPDSEETDDIQAPEDLIDLAEVDLSGSDETDETPVFPDEMMGGEITEEEEEEEILDIADREKTDSDFFEEAIPFQDAPTVSVEKLMDENLPDGGVDADLVGGAEDLIDINVMMDEEEAPDISGGFFGVDDSVGDMPGDFASEDDAPDIQEEKDLLSLLEDDLEQPSGEADDVFAVDMESEKSVEESDSGIEDVLSPEQAEKELSEKTVESEIGEADFLPDDQMEAILERVIRKMFSEKIESIIEDVIEKVVAKEIEKLKNQLPLDMEE